MIGCEKDFDIVGYGVGMCGECLLESEYVFIFFNEIESWDLFLNDSPRKRSYIEYCTLTTGCSQPVMRYAKSSLVESSPGVLMRDMTEKCTKN